MKYIRIFRLLGVTLILSLVLAAIPAMPVMAANDLSLSVTSGKVGDSITVTGTNFSASSDTLEKHARIIFGKDNASVGGSIDTTVKTYKVMSSPYISATTDPNPGYFQTTITVPSSLIDGEIDADVTPGTYYIYVTLEYASGPLASISAVTTFTVSQGAMLDPLSPIQGSAGADVAVSGANFPASTALIFKVDTVVITPKSGDTQTRSSGIFLSTIIQFHRSDIFQIYISL